MSQGHLRLNEAFPTIFPISQRRIVKLLHIHDVFA